MDSCIDRAVAIVGVGALLPDAPNARTFWNNILGKRYSIIDVPPERWSVVDYYDPDPIAPDKTYSKIGGWVRGFTFDWQRFRIPRAATSVCAQPRKVSRVCIIAPISRLPSRGSAHRACATATRLACGWFWLSLNFSSVRSTWKRKPTMPRNIAWCAAPLKAVMRQPHQPAGTVA